MKIDSSVELKKLHAKEIIDYLKNNGSETKKKISEDLNRSFATISNICNEMRERGYLEEQALNDVKVVGRTPKEISLRKEYLLSLCFDLTKKGNIKMAVVNYTTQIIQEKTYHYEEKSSIEELVLQCKGIYEKKILSKFKKEQIIGVGIAVPGIFEKKTHNIVSSEVELFNNQPLKEMFAKALGKDVYIDNESNLCVMSKFKKNIGVKDMADIVYIFAEEGLGIGVVANEQLLYGSGGYAPEICHMPIGNEQIKCHLCGCSGCVESDLRLQGYVDKYNLFSKDKIDTYKEFSEKVYSKDESALKVVEENTEIWGKLLSVINNIFNPLKIYIGGEAGSFYDQSKAEILSHMRDRLLVQGNMLPEIRRDDNSSQTILEGAAEMVFSQWMPL